MKIEELLALGVSGSGGVFTHKGVVVGRAMLDGTVLLFPDAEDVLPKAEVAPAPVARKTRAAKPEAPAAGDPDVEHTPLE